MLKSQTYNKDEIYPDDFTDDDKLTFDILLQQGLILFPKLQNDSWIVKQAVIAYMRKEKGQGVEVNKEDIEKVKEKYNNIIEIN